MDMTCNFQVYSFMFCTLIEESVVLVGGRFPKLTISTFHSYSYPVLVKLISIFLSFRLVTLNSRLHLIWLKILVHLIPPEIVLQFLI